MDKPGASVEKASEVEVTAAWRGSGLLLRQALQWLLMSLGVRGGVLAGTCQVLHDPCHFCDLICFSPFLSPASHTGLLTVPQSHTNHRAFALPAASSWDILPQTPWA